MSETMMEDGDLTVEELPFEIIPVENLTEGALQPCIDWIKSFFKGREYDITTFNGRRECASHSAWISRQKKFFIHPSREKVKQVKAALKPAIIEINRAESETDCFRKEIRKPLTEYEEEQKLKKEKVQKLSNDIKTFSLVDKKGESIPPLELSSDQIKILINKLNGLDISTKGEFNPKEIKSIEKVQKERLQELEQIQKIKLEQDKLTREKEVLTTEKGELAIQEAELQKERDRLIDQKIEEIEDCRFWGSIIENAPLIQLKIEKLTKINPTAEGFGNRLVEAVNLKKEIIASLQKVLPVAIRNDKKKKNEQKNEQKNETKEFNHKNSLQNKILIPDLTNIPKETQRSVNRSVLSFLLNCEVSEQAAKTVIKKLIKEGHPNLFIQY